MNINEILDKILIPRPNGSLNLDLIGELLKGILADDGAQVTKQVFMATPHGFALMWSFAIVMMLIYGWSLLRQHYWLALAVPALLATVLFLEFEKQVSTVSLLLPAKECNIVGTWPALHEKQILVFTAHYDTTTHFGDHFSWGFWGKMQAPATGLALSLPLLGLFLKRQRKQLPAAVCVMATLLASLPFAAMFWFQALGPVLRTPSIGAIDNGGSMAALIALAGNMKGRAIAENTTVKIVFLASEEERTLGSRAYAQLLAEDYAGKKDRIRIVNLESIGTTEKLAYVPEDGFATTRYRTSGKMIASVNVIAKETLGYALEARALPFGTLTDGRSFLTEGFETLTLRSLESDEFPHNLHSVHDSRDRLNVRGLQNAVTLLEAMATANDGTP